MDPFAVQPMPSSVKQRPRRGLPPRLALALALPSAAIVLAVMGYFVAVGFGVTGSVFGTGRFGAAAGPPAAGQTTGTGVEGGGPPAAVRAQLSTLRARIAAHPRDDVALTQLGDMYLAAGKYAQAIPYYERALRIAPGNVAAQTGLAEAREALRETGGSR
jgi:cytochrome c-type biogenesis protein CcmH/NrfG